MPSQACRGIPQFTILLQTAEECGKRRMAGRCGNRFSTRSRSLRWERWRWRLQIRTLFTWGRASIRFLRTAATETEFTSPLMAERTGSTSGWRIRDISGGSWSIRAIRTLCWSRRWATVPGRTKSAEFSGRRMEDEAGRKSSTKTMSRRRLIFVLSREIRAWCTRHCGTAFESRDKKELRTDPAAGCTSPWTKALRGRKLRGTGYRKESGDERELQLRREIMDNACT